MAFIQTIPEQDATGEVRKIYEEDRRTRGYLPNYSLVFSHRPAVKEAWNYLNKAIRSGMDLRRYELITLAAARALRSSYCMLAHGSVLLEKFYKSPQLISIADDPRTSELTPAERAMMAFAEKVVLDATSVTGDDIENLRSYGLTDAEIFDITVTAAARCFFSKTLDALGAEPDHAYNGLESGVRKALTVGRPIEGQAAA